MLEYILYGLIISYYGGFCFAVAYVTYKEYREEQRQRRLEYERLSNEDPGVEMYLESQYANRHNIRLEPIPEEVIEYV